MFEQLALKQYSNVIHFYDLTIPLLTEDNKKIRPEVKKESYVIESKWSSDDYDGHRVMFHNRKTPIVVLFFHGFSDTSDYFTDQMNECYLMGHNVLNVTLDGHGYFKKNVKTLKYEDWLKQAEQALKRAGELGDRVVIVGNSMGGILSAYLSRNKEYMYIPKETRPKIVGQILASPALKISNDVAGSVWFLKLLPINQFVSDIAKNNFNSGTDVTVDLGYKVVELAEKTFPIAVQEKRQLDRETGENISTFVGPDSKWLTQMTDVPTVLLYSALDNVIELSTVRSMKKGLSKLSQHYVREIHADERVAHNSVAKEIDFERLQVENFYSDFKGNGFLSSISPVESDILEKVYHLNDLPGEDFSQIRNLLFESFLEKREISAQTVKEVFSSLPSNSAKLFLNFYFNFNDKKMTVEESIQLSELLKKRTGFANFNFLSSMDENSLNNFLSLAPDESISQSTNSLKGILKAEMEHRGINPTGTSLNTPVKDQRNEVDPDADSEED
jgi:pimeloyl-ACP methyl ester carboxylesterase